MRHFLAKISQIFAHLMMIVILAGIIIPRSLVQADASPWMDATLTAGQRAKLLVAAMTMDEKLAMVHGDTGGTIGGYVGHISAIPRLGIPELNMKDGPAGVGNGANDVTGFPAPITVAAAWDVALMEQYATFMAEEQRGKGVNVHLAPMMNINRAPQAGRNFEGYGEDPYLSSRMAEVAVRGIQSTGLIAVAKHFIDNEQEFQRTTISSEIDIRTQHEIYLPPFVASVNAGAGSIMCSYNKVNGIYACENPDTQNTLLKGELGFQGWIMSDWGATHSTVASALGGLDMEMPSGSYFGRALQSTVIKGEIPLARLDDMVTRILTSMFQAGIFDRAPVGSRDANVQSAAHTAFTRSAAADGLVLLKNDAATLPLDSAKIKSISVFGSAADVDPIIVGGGSGHVNTPYSISPLQGITKRAGSAIAVQYFDVSREPGQPIPADYFSAGLQAEYFNSPDLTGKPVLTQTDPNLDFSWKDAPPAKGVNPSNWSARWSGTLTPKVSGMYNLALNSTAGSRLYIDDKLVIDNWGAQPAQAKVIKRRLIPQKTYTIRVEYTQPGTAGDLHFTWYTPDDDARKAAAAIAAKTDVAIVVIGVNSNEGNDRPRLDSPDVDLIKAVSAANARTVVVLYNPAQILLPWADQVPAILVGWIPGQEAGNALADVLFGDVNPAGRLPVTFARAESEYPANTPEMYPGVNGRVLYAEGLRVGYRHFDSQKIAPLYPFGHGLSYTNFAYSDIKISPSATDRDGTVRVALNVKNTGQRAGAEVVQLYLGFPPEASEPPLQLKGFQKVILQPGESQPVSFTLSAADFSFWSAGLNGWVAYPGSYQVMLGASSRDIRQRGTFAVQGGPLAGEIIPAGGATLAGGAAVAKNAPFVEGFKAKGASATFKVDLAEAGPYNLTLRYASTLRPGAQNTPRTLSLVVNGSKPTQISLPNLANWEMWDFKTEPVTLKAGENTVTYQYVDGDSGDVHLDAIILASVRGAAPVSGTEVPGKSGATVSLNWWVVLLVVGVAILIVAVLRFVWSIRNRQT